MQSLPGSVVVESGTSVALPFTLNQASNVSDSFSATEPVEAFVVTVAQFQSYSQSSSLSNFEFASGNLNSGTVDVVLPAGQYDLTFFNFGSNPSTVSYTPLTKSAVSSSPVSVANLISVGANYTLSPGQYVALELHVPQNSSKIQAYFSFGTPTVSYLMTKEQFAGFLKSGNNISAIYTSESGSFTNALHANVNAGNYYFVTFNPSTSGNASLIFPQGLIITSRNIFLTQPSTSVQIGQLEYIVNFSSTGDVYYVPFGISINGEMQESADPILFLERNGTYNWSLNSVDGKNSLSISNNMTVAADFSISPASGQVSIRGRPVDIVINFYLVLYTITFVETGLPLGSLWSVSMNITTVDSTTNQIVFHLTNYSNYLFTVNPSQGYTATPSSGTIALEGVNVTKDITFTPS